MMRKLVSSGVPRKVRPTYAAAAMARRPFHVVTYPEQPRPASEVPTPGNFFVQMAKTWRFKDEKGVTRTITDALHVGKWLYRNYGSQNIYKTDAPGMGEFYVVADPNEYMKVVQSEGKYPHSMNGENWLMRSFFQNNNRTVGGIFTVGEEWKKFRMVMVKDLLGPKAARSYVDSIAQAARIASDAAKDNEGCMDVWAAHTAYDVFASVLFGRMTETVAGPKPSNPMNPIGIRQCEAVREAMAVSLPMMMNPMELLAHAVGYKTKKFAIFENGFNESINIGIPIAEEFRELERKGELSEAEKNSYFYKLMKRAEGGELTQNEVNEMVAVLLTFSIDTTSALVKWLLVHLAINPDVQDKLLEELKTELNGGDLTTEHVVSGRGEWLPYLHAIMRESQRVTPSVLASILRKIPKNMTLCGYDVPKDSWVMCESVNSQSSPEIMPDHAEFKPERWLPEAVEARKGTATEVLDHMLWKTPFSAGARMCPASRVATLEVLTLISRMVQDWEIRLEDPNIKSIDDVNVVLGAVAQPGPMPKLKLTRRSA